MANTSTVMGFVPVSMDGQPVPTVPLAKKVSSAAAMFIGSPVVVASGVVDTVSETTTGGMTGSVVALIDSNGKSVQNLAAADAGTVIFSYLQNQRYKAHVLSTNYDDTDAGSQRYLISAEAGTARSGDDLGNAYSTRTIGADDGTGQIMASDRVQRIDNAAATAYTEIYCTIADGDWVTP